MQSAGETLPTQPEHPALFSEAFAAQKTGRLAEARAMYEQLLQEHPNFPLGHANYGTVLFSLGIHDKAMQHHQIASELDPKRAMAFNNIGVTLSALRRYPDALRYFKHARSLDLGGDAAAVSGVYANNIADCLIKAADYPRAIIAALEAQRLRVPSAATNINLGCCYRGLGDVKRARNYFAQAVADDPMNFVARKNLGIVALSQHDYAAGWREYMFHRQADGLPAKHKSIPTWQGDVTDPHLRKLLISADQGLGDELLYLTMANSLRARLPAAVQVVWEVDERLMPLCNGCIKGVQFTPRIKIGDVDTTGVTHHLPATQLGQFLRQSLADFPAPKHSSELAPIRDGYFSAIPWPPKEPGVKRIAVSWASRNAQYGHAKSIPLEAWVPLLDSPHDFIDLQYSPEDDVLPPNVRKMGGLNTRNDIYGVAGVLAGCDAVVTVSNTLAHLACAMGKPTFILLPDGLSHFWYWGCEGSTTPWYPSAQIVRQQGRPWQFVFTEIKLRLDNIAVTALT